MNLKTALRVGLILGATFSPMAAHAKNEPGKPDLGPNVLIFSPSMPAADIQAKIDAVYKIQQNAEFGADRNAFLFLPGDYKIDIPIGFYTQVIGLGASPDAVHITGNVHADATHPHNNATCTFWRSVEGFSLTPTGGPAGGGDITAGTMRWAVSQAAPFRRMHIRGDIALHQLRGWASGGWMSDSLIDGNVDSGTQQQWISRNSEWKSWTGSNWNMVFVGVPNPPQGEWPAPPFTKVADTPIVREKPFLVVDEKGRYSVRIPSLRTNTAGITWHSGSTPGKSIPLDRFYIARAGTDTAATINAQLAAGKHLLLTPGIYDLTEPIRVTRPDTVVLGLGFATLRPTNGTAALTTADADGIEIAGLLIDAGATESPILVQIGETGSKASHARNPISVDDVFFRVGGAGIGKAKINLEIDANDTLIDHTWIWRADHGAGVGWEKNLSDNGLVVNADNVTAYGLFVEHHQQYQVLWNGNHGRTYFYQSEIPYDPPTQAAWSPVSTPEIAPGSNVAGVPTRSENGWPSYKVAATVTSHEAWGLGIYSVFRHPDVTLTRAIEVPSSPDVKFHHMITVALDNLGEITNVIDNAGGPATPAAPGKPRTTPKVTDFP
jgi:hypothetical protein